MVSILLLGGGLLIFASAVLTFLGVGDFCVLSMSAGSCFFTMQDFLIAIPLLFIAGRIMQWYELFNPLKI